MTENKDNSENKKNNSAEESAARKSVPSDGLFKTIMEDTVAAQEFLEYYLPENFKELVDLSKITVEKESFVEDDLKRALSDIIYKIKTKDNEDAYAFVLIEQQSTPDHLIAFRLWKYMLLLCDRYIKNHRGRSKKTIRLPLIMPIVFYNGTKKYNAPLNLWSLFSQPALAKQFMTDDYRLVDLQSMSDEEIKQKDHLGIIEYFMKHIHTRDMLKLWAEFLKSFKEAILIDKDRGYIYIKHLLWYSDTKVPEDKQQELNNLIMTNLNQNDGETIMRTIAQKYIEEGRQQAEANVHLISQRYIEEGREEGKEEGKEELIKMMLNTGNSVDIIAKVTGLPIEKLQKFKESL